jgi:hypothetical protein
VPDRARGCNLYACRTPHRRDGSEILTSATNFVTGTGKCGHRGSPTDPSRSTSRGVSSSPIVAGRGRAACCRCASSSTGISSAASSMGAWQVSRSRGRSPRSHQADLPRESRSRHHRPAACVPRMRDPRWRTDPLGSLTDTTAAQPRTRARRRHRWRFRARRGCQHRGDSRCLVRDLCARAPACHSLAGGYCSLSY